LSFHDNQITRHENIACVIAVPRQSSSRRDRRNGHPDCRCVPIQIDALQVVGNPNGIEDRGVETLWLIRFPVTCREDSTTRFIVGYDRSPELSIS